MFVSIPTYNRFAECCKAIDAMLSGSLVPTKILVIDNSGSGNFLAFARDNHNTEHWKNVFVRYSPINLGCSRAWNLALRELFAEDPERWVLIANDDIFVAPDCLEKFDIAIQERGNTSPIFCAGGVDAPNAFSLFATRYDRLMDVDGIFDEVFLYPYCEDGDMGRRLWLKGFELDRVEGASADHIGSATLKAFNPEELQFHHNRFSRNAQYFEAKWGVSHNEIYSKNGYTKPFNGSEVDRELFMSYLVTMFGE